MEHQILPIATAVRAYTAILRNVAKLPQAIITPSCTQTDQTSTSSGYTKAHKAYTLGSTTRRLVTHFGPAIGGRPVLRQYLLRAPSGRYDVLTLQRTCCPKCSTTSPPRRWRK